MPIQPNPNLQPAAESSRARVHTVRWMTHQPDSADPYRFGGRPRSAPPILPPARAPILDFWSGDRAWLRLVPGPGRYWDPFLVVLLQRDQAAQHLGLQGETISLVLQADWLDRDVQMVLIQGAYVPTSLQKQDAVAQSLHITGNLDPAALRAELPQQTLGVRGDYAPNLVLGDRAMQTLHLQGGLSDVEPVLLELTRQANQALNLTGDYVLLPEVLLQLVEQAAQQMLVEGTYTSLIQTAQVLEAVQQSVDMGTGEYATSGGYALQQDGETLGLSLTGTYALYFPWDDAESYVAGSLVDGLAGGWVWLQPYVARSGVSGIQNWENWENYADGENINGTNLGDWSGEATVTRDGGSSVNNRDDAESYADGVDMNGLTGGLGFTGPWVSR